MYIINIQAQPEHKNILGDPDVKDFFSRYSYGIVKMFINQFAISLFGAVLAMATSSAGNDVLTLVVSIFAIIFYLFLIYNMTWEIGATDKISVDVNKKEYKPFVGFAMAFLANIPNFIIAAIFTIGMTVAQTNGQIAAMSKLAAIVVEGMYFGLIMTVDIGGAALHTFWWTYFIITIPAIITAGIAYLLGHKNFRFIAGFINKRSNGQNTK